MVSKEILYINLGDNVPYTYDKISGRVIWWSKSHNITLLVPELSRQTIFREIVSHNPKKIKSITLPFTKHQTISPLGIIYSYFIRLLITPIILKDKQTFNIAISNSAFLVDVFPVLVLKIFRRCPHWILIMDSIVPSPSKRHGNRLINYLTYAESLLVGYLANKFADVILTVNPELKTIMVARGIKSSKILFTQNGLFINKINRILPSTKNHYDAVYQGRISANKGILDLVDVWSIVVKKRPKATLAVMGNGLSENIRAFKEKIRKLKLEKNISYLGFTPSPQKYEILKGSKVFLYLSKVNADESWGISLMEAMACGLPSVGYDLPIYEHIYKTKGLIRINNGDTVAVATTVIKLLADEKKYQRLSQESAKFAGGFDWNIIADKDLELVDDIMKDSE